ncbi:MAG: YwmB family TATA-box binding protein [Firmicutes bacterium]|nr:YwmB family TATA-box binding protein [Bacillota bacterium]
MVKFILFSTFCIILIFYHFESLSNPKLEQLGDGQFSIYSREIIQSPLVLSKTNIGFGFIYTIHSLNANQLRQKFNVIDGESIVLDNFIHPNQILRQLGYTQISSQQSANLFTIYAYSSRGRDFIRKDNNRINLQVAVRDGRVTIGWPVILGSF